MKAFVQYYIKICTGELIEALGTDGVYILDGRNNIDTMRRDAEEYAYTLHNIHKYHGYMIMRGNDFYSDNAITPMIELCYVDLAINFGV